MSEWKCRNCKSKEKPNNITKPYYCIKCGCAVCLKHKGTYQVEPGVKTCEKNKTPHNCEAIWNKKKELKKKDQLILINKQLEKDKEIEQEIKNVSEDFYEKIKVALEEIAKFKHQFIDEIVTKYEFINQSKIAINLCSSLDNNAKRQWKKIYEEKIADTSDVPNIFGEEKNFLVNLARQYHDNAERTKNETTRIVQQIQIELAFLPFTNITELDARYHNYENLTTSELRSIKDELIAAIREKRAEKKLIYLIKEAESCSDHDLWSFIEALNDFADATDSIKRKVHQDRRPEVSDTLYKLNQRWNNLSEDQKLTNYWNKAISNFNSWLQEAENLSLPSSDPFADFTTNIKNYRTQTDIEQKEQEAYQHILAKFKEKVKQELGAEQRSGEYQTIDQATKFSEIKLARNNINVSRQSPDSPIPQQDENSPGDSPSPENPQQDNKDKNDPEKNDLPKDLTDISIDKVKEIVISKLKLLLKNKETTKLCCKELCKGEENWENYIKSINDKKEVVAFSKEMEKIIEGLEDKKQGNFTKGQPEQNFWVTPTILVVSFLLFTFSANVLIKRFHIRWKAKQSGQK